MTTPNRITFFSTKNPVGSISTPWLARWARVFTPTRGWQADLCLVRPDDTAAPAVERQLADKHYDGVVIGGGIRLPPKSLLQFEAVINAVHRAAPGAFIAFNTRPEDSADAAARWLKGD